MAISSSNCIHANKLDFEEVNDFVQPLVMIYQLFYLENSSTIPGITKGTVSGLAYIRIMTEYITICGRIVEPGL